jgi:serine/threonine protein kinase
MKLESGMHVTQNVRLVSLIGEGAMGCVWLAEHLGLHTRVAVKFIAEELARDHADVLLRFRQEAAASAQIKSPYVVQTYDHGVMEDGTPYIVMEYLEGEGLGARLERNEKISMAQTAQVLVQAGKALDRAHQLGIIHRDIKPDNIFLSTAEDGMICKVLDFGIAKHTKLADMTGVTLPGTTVGTPEYMSREQVMTAREVDAKADLWALTVVAYQCLTGELPFVGETLGMVCVAICKGTYTAPSQLTPELPPGVDAWFERGLNKDPARRFTSGKELALAFLRLLPREGDELLEPMIGTGQFSLPPPSSGETGTAPTFPRLGSDALLRDLMAERDSERGAPSRPGDRTPAARGSGRGRRDGTPTFSGSSAELRPLAARTEWRRRALGAMGVLALVVVAIVGAALWRHGNGQSLDDPAAAAASNSRAAASAQAATMAPSATTRASEATAPANANRADQTNDAGTAESSGSSDAGSRFPPGTRPWRRGSKGKGGQKDLGF